MYRALPAPPRLHWGVVFALSVVTIGLFGMIWMVVQASWVKKATRNAKPFWWCLAYLLSLPTIYLVAIGGGVLIALLHRQEMMADFIVTLSTVIRIGMFVLYIVAAYSLKGGLEAEPIGIPLTGIMTFFFSATYFQYHLFDYNVEGRVAEQLSGFTEPALADAPEVRPQT
jgi:ABC-type multidrug transport system permease subunit